MLKEVGNCTNCKHWKGKSTDRIAYCSSKNKKLFVTNECEQWSNKIDEKERII